MKSMLAAVFLFAASSVFAHGGEKHDDAAPAAAHGETAALPRAAAGSEDFELVLVLDGRRLLLYLDRHDSNEPVAGAKVDIEGGGLKGSASEISPGVYAVAADALKPGRHALTVAVEAGDTADLLAATLDMPSPATQPAAASATRPLPLLAGAIALVGGLGWAWRRRTQPKEA